MLLLLVLKLEGFYSLIRNSILIIQSVDLEKTKLQFIRSKTHRILLPNKYYANNMVLSPILANKREIL